MDSYCFTGSLSHDSLPAPRDSDLSIASAFEKLRDRINMPPCNIKKQYSEIYSSYIFDLCDININIFGYIFPTPSHSFIITIYSS